MEGRIELEKMLDNDFHCHISYPFRLAYTCSLFSERKFFMYLLSRNLMFFFDENVEFSIFAIGSSPPKVSLGYWKTVIIDVES